jgi:hypothetical protein
MTATFCSHQQQTLGQGELKLTHFNDQMLIFLTKSYKICIVKGNIAHSKGESKLTELFTEEAQSSDLTRHLPLMCLKG